ncbi:MAG: hypothetical protein M5U26_28625 [Planctomycetota bacterium]|nr:hypothetical protein [Planctomycetota bacterium]
MIRFPKRSTAITRPRRPVRVRLSSGHGAGARLRGSTRGPNRATGKPPASRAATGAKMSRP